MKELKKIALGVDIGGSHITAAAVDLDRFEIISGTCFSKEINNKASKEDVLETWAETIQKALDAGMQDEAFHTDEVMGIGIAIPGPFDYPNGIGMFEGNDKYESLYNVDVRKPLSKLVDIAGERIHFFNDASSFAVGAALRKNVLQKRVVGVTLGTGFGAAFLIEELPAIEDASIPENGCLWDKPFKESISDNYFSTRWFVSRYEMLTGKTCEGVSDIAVLDNGFTHQIFDEFAESLSEFLDPHLKKFKAEVLLIGGNIAKSHHLFLKDLRKSLGASNGIQIEVVDDTETCNLLGSSHLMTLDFWKRQSKLKAFF